MPFKKGQSGNPGGSRLYKALSNALIMELKRNPHRANTVANKLITMAEEGDIQAHKLLFDRLEGKAEQSIDVTHSGQVEHNLTVEQRRARVRELLASDIVDAEILRVDDK